MTPVLERLICERRRPENVRSDNRPEFNSWRMRAGQGLEGWHDPHPTGKPMQNGHVESELRLQAQRGMVEMLGRVGA